MQITNIFGDIVSQGAQKPEGAANERVIESGQGAPLKDSSGNAALGISPRIEFNEESKLPSTYMEQLSTPLGDHKDRPRSSRQQQKRRGIGSDLQAEVYESLDMHKSQISALEETVQNLQIELQDRMSMLQ